MKKIKPKFQWTDELGVKPDPVARVNFTGEHLYFEILDNGKWVKVAERENCQWVSHLSNVKVKMAQAEDGTGCLVMEEEKGESADDG
jgi:hypothetical protein